MEGFAPPTWREFSEGKSLSGITNISLMCVGAPPPHSLKQQNLEPSTNDYETAAPPSPSIWKTNQTCCVYSGCELLSYSMFLLVASHIVAIFWGFLIQFCPDLFSILYIHWVFWLFANLFFNMKPKDCDWKLVDGQHWNIDRNVNSTSSSNRIRFKVCSLKWRWWFSPAWISVMYLESILLLQHLQPLQSFQAWGFSHWTALKQDVDQTGKRQSRFIYVAHFTHIATKCALQD